MHLPVPGLTEKAAPSPEPVRTSQRLVQVWTPRYPFADLTYIWPEESGVPPRTGLRVVVPLRKQRVTGYVVHPDAPPVQRPDVQYRPVDLVLDTQPMLPDSLLRVLTWAAEYYMQPLGAYIHMALPPGLHALHRVEVRITPEGLRVAARLIAHWAGRRIPVWGRILLLLTEIRKATIPKIRRNIGTGRIHAGLQYLRARGWIELREKIQHRGKVPKTLVIHLVRLPQDGERASLDQRRILTYLAEQQRDVLFEELAEWATETLHIAPERMRARLRRMADRGWIQLYTQIHPRPIVWDLPESPQTGVIELNAEQQQVVREVIPYIRNQRFHIGLLHGVTGSGKTEVYIRLIREVIIQGRTALVLMPEIALIPAITQRFRRVFGDQLAILHSELTPTQRTGEWWRIRTGEARIVLGARSAVFAPLENIGIIVVDEEQDGSYRQDELPVYHARDLAIARARLENSVVLLVTATPSVESYAHARQGTYTLYMLRKRAIPGAVLPRVHLIDMRKEYTQRGHPFFSQLLIDRLQQTLARDETAIVLINRRGYAPLVQCRACGSVIMCTQCSIHMVFHRRDRVLKCHYCGMEQPVPRRCPICEEPYLFVSGLGTERVQALLQKMFPDVRIGILDRDVIARPRELFQLLGDFYAGRVQILVGTQMVAKGHHFPKVTLVGVLEADTSIGWPDYRAHERLFQLITQVVGRAGRAERPGEAIIQTYRPEVYALRFACAHDYDGFFREELQYRRRFRYPPFVSLILIETIHTEHALALQYAQHITHRLREIDLPNTQVHGPVQPLLWRLQGRYRYHVLIRTTDRKVVRRRIREILDDLPFRREFLRIRVDPYTLA